MRKSNQFYGILQPFMVEPYKKWCKEQGLEPYNKYSIEEWKQTEDYYLLNSLGEGAPIDILHNEIEDDDEEYFDETQLEF